MQTGYRTFLGCLVVAATTALSGAASAAVIFSPADFSLTHADDSRTLMVNAIGFHNLVLTFNVQSTGSVDPGCGGGGFADCWYAQENAVQIVALPGLDIPIAETAFGPFALASADTTFDLTFVVDVTGGDEGADFTMITIEGEGVAEPATLGLMALGLAGLAGYRRRRRT